MNIRALLQVTIAAVLPAFLASRAAAQTPASPAEEAAIVGNWYGVHRDWKDIIVIRADGTFTRPGEDGGTWKLTSQLGHLVLELSWKDWKPTTMDSVNPNTFEGPKEDLSALRRLAIKQIGFSELGGGNPIEDPALKAALNDSSWQLREGNRFTLHADGTTTSSWHDRKGTWKTVAANKIQLAIGKRALPPETLTVESGATVLRWADADWGMLAFRLAAGGDKKPALAGVERQP